MRFLPDLGRGEVESEAAVRPVRQPVRCPASSSNSNTTESFRSLYSRVVKAVEKDDDSDDENSRRKKKARRR